MTSEKENKELLTKKNQPIKIITQQDINALEITLEQLQSWTSTLEILNKFLILNKKQLIKKDHSKIPCKCPNIQNLSQ